MSDPIEYNTFTHMLIEHAPYIIMGAISIVGATVIVLKQMGVLIFSKKDRIHEDCKHCSNNGDLLTPKKDKCTSHDELHDKQTKMLSQQEINTKALENGKAEFKIIKDDITELKVGVGILLDRSGGRPPNTLTSIKDM